MTKKVYPPALVQTISDMYAADGTQAEIAAELGLTLKVVQRVMWNHGIVRRPPIKRDQRGSRNATWRGDSAGYQAFHIRVEVARGKPQHCEVCGTSDPTKHYDWANLTGQYHEVSDYKRMCRSCHHRYDGTIKNIRRGEVPRAR